MNFESDKKEIEDSSFEQKKKNEQNLDISSVLDKGDKELFNAVKKSDNENGQIVHNIETYPGVELEDVKFVKDVVEKTNNDINQVVDNSKKNVNEIIKSDNETNQDRYKETYNMLTSQVFDNGDKKASQLHLEYIKDKFNLLDSESIQEIDKKLNFIENKGGYIDASKILNDAIQDYKNREIYSLIEKMPKDSSAGDKFSFIEKKIDELDNNGQLHGISARQLNLLFKQVLRGEKTVTDLRENSFTLGENKVPLTLESIAEDILLNDIVISNMETLKRIGKSLDLSKSYVDEIEKVEKGEYVEPEGHYGILIKKANEIMGLKRTNKSSKGNNLNRQWTDVNNPPTNWDKNAKAGDKIRY